MKRPSKLRSEQRKREEEREKQKREHILEVRVKINMRSDCENIHERRKERAMSGKLYELLFGKKFLKFRVPIVGIEIGKRIESSYNTDRNGSVQYKRKKKALGEKKASYERRVERKILRRGFFFGIGELIQRYSDERKKYENRIEER